MSFQAPETIADWVSWLVVIAAICGIAWVAISVIGVPVPSWAVTMVVIFLAAMLALALIGRLKRGA